MKTFNDKALKLSGIREIITVAGYSIMSGASENLGFAIIKAGRLGQAQNTGAFDNSIRDEIMAAGATIPLAEVRVFQPPAIMGLGVSGGVTFALRTTGEDTPQQFERQMGKLLGLLNDKKVMPEILYAFSGFNARTPQIYLDIDRTKAEALGVPADRIFTALQSNFASLYVNDFNLYGYSFKVKIQLDGKERSTLDALEELQVQNNSGEMVPLSAIAEAKVMLGARKIERFNQNMAAVITAIPVPGASTARIMNRIEELIRTEFSKDYDISWTDMSYQEKNNSGRIVLLMTLAVIFGYLFLVAQYESWSIPLPVILSVSFASLGGVTALYLTGMLLDIYAQLGLIMLIGLCAKSTILMVEFSMQERITGKSIGKSGDQRRKLPLPRGSHDCVELRHRRPAAPVRIRRRRRKPPRHRNHNVLGNAHRNAGRHCIYPADVRRIPENA